MRQSTAILLSVVMVMSVVAPAAGAQTATQTDTGPITYEFDGSPETLVIDTSAMTEGSSFSVEYTTQNGPASGTTTLARDSYNTANLDSDQLVFLAQGAYPSINVTVSEYQGGEPKFTEWSGGSSKVLGKTIVGSTGGDSDLTCDAGEQIAQMIQKYPQLDCQPTPGSTGVNTTGTDAQQIKTDIYQSAQNEQASAEIYQTTLDNYLQDSKTQARILGKNAYIRALNNGSSESAAKTAAKGAVADYYSVKQATLIKKWNQVEANREYLEGVETNESISDSYVDYNISHYSGSWATQPRVEGVDTHQVTLANGSTIGAIRYDVFADYGNGYSVNPYVTIDKQQTSWTIDAAIYAQWSGVDVAAPNSNYDNLVYSNWSSYQSDFAEIQTQNNAVQSDMDTLAANTYSAYQSGEINNTDLIDPYVFAQEFSPGSEYQGWAATQLTMLGTNSPEAMDSVGRFNVSAQSGEYSGILMSQTNPASGQFETNTTYDPANITGTQYVVTDSQIHELTTPFEIRSIETASGESRQNVTIEMTTYETASINVSQLREEYERLAYERAQIEAREKALAGGGGLFGGSTEQSTLAIVAVAGAAILLLRN